MKFIFKIADDYAKTTDWKIFALLKLCLCSIGVMWGLATPKKFHKFAAFASVAVFVATYIPLMCDFLPFLEREIKAKKVDDLLDKVLESISID